MKGKGSRGMPGKRGGFQSGQLKKRMGKRDFEQRDEWVQVAASLDEEVGTEPGATKAVSAGVTPKGQDFLWTLVRGVDAPGEEEGAALEPVVYAVDGACRCCQFPMPSAQLAAEAGGAFSLTCGLCGTKYSLTDGAVLEFCPKNNPAQVVAALVNEKKGPQAMATLKTRVSKSGKVYLRLPDGTLLNRIGEAPGATAGVSAPPPELPFDLPSLPDLKLPELPNPFK